MKYKSYIWMMLAAGGLITAASCSDFDDYNTAWEDSSNPAADLTLWENITSDSNLSTFAELVQKAGFDDELAESHYYTVWAPQNSALVGSEYLTADSATLITKFIQSHIADYSHVATGEWDEDVIMLNTKVFDFVGAGTYTLDGVDVTAEQASVNGMLYTLDGLATYRPNVYQYIYECEDADSVAKFFQKYEYSVLDEENSVEGPMVDGKPTYVDSVMDTYNSILNSMRAKVESEDSSYSMLLPTNKAWISQYEKISSYLNYLATTTVQDLSSTTETTLSKIPTTSVTIDNEFYQDSLTKMKLVNPLVFNNNTWYNKWTVDDSAEYSDTIYTTTGKKFSNPREILAQTISKEQMSNGWTYVVDSLAFQTWEYLAGENDIYPSSDYQARIIGGTSYSYTVDYSGSEELLDSIGFDPSEQGSKLRYVIIQPSGSYSKPELDIFLPNVYSTTYSFYCVFVPNLDGYTTDQMPNRVNFALNYCKANGSVADWLFSSDGAENPASSKQQPFENDYTKLDTIYLGDFTFPVAYEGIGDDYMPNLKITSPFSVFTGYGKTRTRDLRIAAIIMRPVDYVEYLEETNQSAARRRYFNKKED